MSDDQDHLIHSTHTGFPSTSIGQLASRVGSGITPTGGEEVYKDSGTLFIRSQNVTFEGLKLEDVAYIDAKTHDSMRRSEVFPFDVLINITGASIGRCCYMPSGLGPCNVNQHVCVIRLPIPSESDAKFLSASLSSSIGQSQISRLNAGGNREGLNYQQLRSFVVPWPRKEERETISRVIAAVDATIARSEALIGKYKAIRKGLIHDLLTRGLNIHGQLRPPPSESPADYCDTPLGKLPKAWKVVRLGDQLQGIEQGWSPDCEPEPAMYGEWGVLKTTAVVWEGYQDYENKRLPNRLIPIAELEVHAGDVLMTRGGPNSRVGVVVHVSRTQPRLLLSDKIYRLVPRVSMDGQFLVQCLTSNSTQVYLSTLKTGLAESQTNISQQIVRALWVPVPCIEEQKAVCERIGLSERRIQCEALHLCKLRQIKVGLMQDLLTGKKRVKIEAMDTKGN